MKNKSLIIGIVIALLMDAAVVGILVSEYMQSGEITNSSIFRGVELFEGILKKEPV